MIASFAILLLLMVAIAATAMHTTQELGLLASRLNERVVTKTRLAGAIVDLMQRIQFADDFLLAAQNGIQDDLVRRAIEGRAAALDSRLASYIPYLDSDIERSLVRNLRASSAAYLQAQTDILALEPAQRANLPAGSATALSDAAAEASRQATGLLHLSETQARSAREQALDVVSSAETVVLTVSGCGIAVAGLILLVLRISLFQPLRRITRALLGLAEGRLDLAVTPSGRGDEVDAVAQAVDRFRQTVAALAAANTEVTAARSEAEALARHDALTGLANRRVLTGLIAERLAQSRPCAMLLVDLDRFKAVNDLHGMALGDGVLCTVAERLQTAMAGDGTVARLASDEFAILLDQDGNSEGALRAAKRVLAVMAPPVAVQGRSFAIGASIGIAMAPADGQDASALLHAADLALRKVKADHRGAVGFFEAEMDIQLRSRADLEVRLRAALAACEVRPHYQPLFDLQNDSLMGFEVLARWHDGATLISPAAFIPVAEDAGLIPTLTFCVLGQACQDARHWPAHLRLALNVTPALICDPAFPDRLLAALETEGFDPARLDLEITENALIGDLAAAKAVVALLRQRGVGFSLDDFGTGYASLHQLRDLRFDKLKVDQSFVQSMHGNPEATTIVETILGLGRNLGVKTVAEGIETHEQLQALRARGCNYGQGYLLGRPLNAEAAGQLVDDRIRKQVHAA